MILTSATRRFMKPFFFFSLLITIFSPLSSFGAGSALEFSSIQIQTAGTPYTGLGQMTRELRHTDEEASFIEYTLDGKKRRLWDDDGLGILFLYHRNIAAKVFDKEMTVDSKLPMPKEPLLYGLDKLATEFESMKKDYAQKSGKEAEKLKEKIENVLKKIQAVKKYVASDRFRQVSDLQASGLEDLINDLDSNHTYAVEVGNDQVKRGKLSDLIAKGVVEKIGDEFAGRCRDTITIDWKQATAKFFVNRKSNAQVSRTDEGESVGDQKKAD